MKDDAGAPRVTLIRLIGLHYHSDVIPGRLMHSAIPYHEKPLSKIYNLLHGVPMSHHIFTHHRHRFGRRLFAGLLVLLVVLALVYLYRRHSMRKSGMQPKPVMEDLGDIYRELMSRFDNSNYGGIIDEILGRRPVSV